MINKIIDLNCPYPQTYKFILTHKPSVCLEKFGDVANKIFISENGVEGTVQFQTEFPTKVYGELGAWDWISKQIRPIDEACLMHFRRKLKVMPGVTLPYPIRFQCSLVQQLAYYHSPKLAQAFMATLTPSEQSVFNSNALYPYCIFNSPCEVLQDWLAFVKQHIFMLKDILKCGDTEEQIKEFVKNDGTYLIGAEGKDTRLEYQSRLLGFCVERFSSLYWTLQNSVPKNHSELILLEENQKI